MLTFLFTDIADSTALWQKHPNQMSQAQASHDAMLKSIVPRQRGRLVKSTGDGVLAAFDEVNDAAQAAVELQRSLVKHDWGPIGPLRVRMGLHSGAAQFRDNDYYGTPVNKAARVTSLANGGQILLTDVTNLLLREKVTTQFSFTNLGAFRLKGLSGQTTIFQLNHPDLPDRFPPLRGGDQTPSNLPITLTNFIGREKDKGDILQLLVDTDQDQNRARLVTLVGPGGTGKTRLSIESGRELRPAFPDGIWLVELDVLTDPDALPYAVLEALSLQENPGTDVTQLLTTYLNSRQALLIFDNCEHLVEPSARLIENILKNAPLIQILASSRESLGLSGEVVYRVPSLPLPPEGTQNWEEIRQSAAVRLFINRGEAAGTAQMLVAENGPAIVSICRRLDGIPLAIELAAARLRVFSPAQILERLDDRFRLLTGGTRTALPRLQTLQALIDWSYDLLDTDEQQFLQELSVFRGGWTIDMALEISPDRDVYSLLPQLVEKSLVVATPVEEPGASSQMRYAFLETIRQYARDRLMESGRSAEIRDRHLIYFVNYSRIDFTWSIDDFYTFYKKIRADIENCKTATTWALSQDSLAALEITSNLTFFWADNGLGTEGLSWVNEALAAEDGNREADDPASEVSHQRNDILASGYLARAWLLVTLGLNQQALIAGQEAEKRVRAIDDPLRLIFILMLKTIAGLNSGEFSTAQAASEEALEMPNAHQSTLIHGALLTTNAMAKVFIDRDIDGARVMMEEALRLRGPQISIGSGLLPLLTLEVQAGHWERSRELVQMALDNLVKRNFPKQSRYYGMYSSFQGHIERKAGNLDAALRLYVRPIRIFQDLNQKPAVINILECYAMIAAQKKEFERAGRLFGAAENLRFETESAMTPLEELEYDAVIETFKAQYDAQKREAAWHFGASMTYNQTVEYALNYAEV